MNEPSRVRPLLPEDQLAALRSALAGFTIDALHERIGLAGQAALSRGDLAGARRYCPAGDRPATLARLFMLGCEVAERDATAALAPLPLEAAVGAGLVQRSAGTVRAALDLRPYAVDGWWVVADLGSDVRPGPVRPDHVLGIGAASLTLAQSTPREPVGIALDVGTGCGVQALHLAQHAATVVATDISSRALRLAATTAALSGQEWDLRKGSLLDPAGGDRFDLVVANPPFVVSAGRTAADGGFDYRDSGFAGDGVSRALVQALPSVLAPAGAAQLLANWAIRRGTDWEEVVQGWLEPTGCDAWVWQREVADPGEYVTLWLRDAGEQPGTPQWYSRYDGWLDWFEATGVIGVGMGLVTLWHRAHGTPVQVLEDVRQAIEQPVGDEVAQWMQRHRRLAARDDGQLLEIAFVAGRDLVRSRDDLLAAGGWTTARQVLRQSHGMRWELDLDDAIAMLVAGCTGAAPLRAVLAVLADAIGADATAVAEATMPVVRDLVSRGFLTFAEAPDEPIARPASAR